MLADLPHHFNPYNEKLYLLKLSSYFTKCYLLLFDGLMVLLERFSAV